MENLDPKSIDVAGVPAGPRQVEILIVYDAGGVPSAHPDPAEVGLHGVITWRTKAGEVRPFQIVPKQGPHQGMDSHPKQDYQELKRGAGAVVGRFSYSITSNGHTVDPDVVIKPRAN